MDKTNHTLTIMYNENSASFSHFPHSRQDVANQMCTKTKEECEKHYMKHFINNPLFASTLLNLKQAEEAKTADTAIPFHCKYLPVSVRESSVEVIIINHPSIKPKKQFVIFIHLVVAIIANFKFFFSISCDLGTHGSNKT